jgi:serine protease Do
MRSRRSLKTASFAIACLVWSTAFAPAGSQNSRRTPVVDVVERVRPAVVNIHSERTVMAPPGQELFSHAPSQNHVNGMGTGIIIDPRGYIITNQHVVDEVSLLRIRLNDGTSHGARVLVRDHESDLALLKIDVGRALPTVPIGTSSDLMVGETVVAIGNAYGYEHSVTVGIISALKRDVTLNKDVSYKSLIQTDASINPGNSGGPLLNIHGELIGVNVAIRAGAQGIGFAIPVDSVLRVAADMMSIRQRNGTWHGIACRDCVGEDESEKVASAKKADNGSALALAAATASLPRWLLVERAESDSPAARAGLQPGDIVIKVNKTPVCCRLELERALLDHEAGDTIGVVVRRKGTEKNLELVLQSLQQQQQPVHASTVNADVIWRKLGLTLSTVSSEQVSRLNRQLHGGLVVIDVNPDSPAGKAGIQRGDVLVGLHQWETVSIDNVLFVLNHPDLASFSPIRFFILRNGQLNRGWLPQIEN